MDLPVDVLSNFSAAIDDDVTNTSAITSANEFADALADNVSFSVPNKLSDNVAYEVSFSVPNELCPNAESFSCSNCNPNCVANDRGSNNCANNDTIEDADDHGVHVRAVAWPNKSADPRSYEDADRRAVHRSANGAAFTRRVGGNANSSGGGECE